MRSEPARRRRGRPPHPDILTPREWQVLDLLREGLTNEQIAQRLHISFATAKYHVAEIISKLGVVTREEASAWQPPPARPWWAPLVAWLRPPTLAKAAIATGALAALVGLAVVVWATREGEEPSAVAQISSPTANAPTIASQSPVPTPSPASVALDLGGLAFAYAAL